MGVDGGVPRLGFYCLMLIIINGVAIDFVCRPCVCFGMGACARSADAGPLNSPMIVGVHNAYCTALLDMCSVATLNLRYFES